jgi:uncharacterized membrane protein HdeD (DUF308 family)
MDTHILQNKTAYALDRRWVFMSGLMVFLAGVVHLVIAPYHFEHAPAHALFFGLSGVIEIIWGLNFWRRPSKNKLGFGIVVAISLIVLWAITRVLPAPFTDVPEEIDLGGIIDKLLEIGGVIFLTRSALSSMDRHQAWRLVVGTALIAVLLGIVLYQVGMLAEPLFPFLRAPVL